MLLDKRAYSDLRLKRAINIQLVTNFLVALQFGEYFPI